MSKTFDVVICGAGSIGVAAAYYLATQQQITNVLLVDQHPPLSQTSAKSGENYRNWWPQNLMVRFTNRSINLMETLARESGNAINLTRRGYAYVSARPEAQRDIEKTVTHYRKLDVGDIRLHTGSGLEYAPIVDDFEGQPDGADILFDRHLIRQTFPHFTNKVQAVIHARRCGAVSAQQLGMLLLKQAKRLGLEELRGEVIAVEQDARGIKSIQIETSHGTEYIQTRRFVNAAGPFAPRINAMLGVELPIFSVLQQKVAIQDPLGVVPRTMPFTIFMDDQFLNWSDDEKELLHAEPELHWLLEKFPGGLHIKPEGGYDSTWLKLGWAFNQTSEPPVWQPKRMPEFVDIVLRGASTLVPGLGAYINNVSKPVPHYGGYYTKTQENLPLIGPLAIPGAYIAGAFSGFGTMTSCAAGELIAAWVSGGELPDYAAVFSPARYNDPDFIASPEHTAAQGEL